MQMGSVLTFEQTIRQHMFNPSLEATYPDPGNGSCQYSHQAYYIDKYVGLWPLGPKISRVKKQTKMPKVHVAAKRIG